MAVLAYIQQQPTNDFDTVYEYTSQHHIWSSRLCLIVWEIQPSKFIWISINSMSLPFPFAAVGFTQSLRRDLGSDHLQHLALTPVVLLTLVKHWSSPAHSGSVSVTPQGREKQRTEVNSPQWDGTREAERTQTHTSPIPLKHLPLRVGRSSLQWLHVFSCQLQWKDAIWPCNLSGDRGARALWCVLWCERKGSVWV